MQGEDASFQISRINSAAVAAATAFANSRRASLDLAC